MNELALFAGAGGGILGGHLLGWRTVCAVEWEQYPASVLCARQNDKILPPFPIWDDVQTFDGKPWRGIVDVVSGGFPCQDISVAGGGAESTQSDQECGEKCHGLLARFDPDSHLWRTVQCSLLEDLNESLQTLPQWGMTVGGELYLRQTLVRPIEEKEFGYWLTPNCMDSLPPRSPEALKRQYENNRQGRTTHSTLREQVVYPPPNQMWPTPSTRDHKGGYIGGRIRNGKVSWDTLDVAVQHTDNQSKDGGQLNPTWVEWLMGWPLGWTDLKPLEMDKSLYVQQQLGNY